MSLNLALGRLATVGSGDDSEPQPDVAVVSGTPRLYLIRGHKVLLDSDLAKLYDVSTGHLNERVRRNRGRVPPDFMFALSTGEAEALRSQIAISKARRGGRRYLTSVFTQQGVAMLSSVLNRERAFRFPSTAGGSPDTLVPDIPVQRQAMRTDPN